MGRKSNKKRKINYNNRMKTIRRFVNFDYDLRRPLSGGQKSAITKAFREIHSYRDRRYIHLPQHRDETKTEYKARRKEIKTYSGQDDHRGRLVKGVFVDVPTGFEARMVKKTKRIRRKKKETARQFKARKKRVTTNIIEIHTKNFTDNLFPANQALMADDPEAEAARIWDFMGTEYDEVAVNYSGRGRSLGYDKRGDDGSIFEAFVNELSKIVDKYLEQINYAASGYILRTYI